MIGIPIIRTVLLKSIVIDNFKAPYFEWGVKHPTNPMTMQIKRVNEIVLREGATDTRVFIQDEQLHSMFEQALGKWRKTDE